MPKRNYSNTAPPVALGATVNNAATTLTVSSTTGYPAAPFLLGIERGTANEEVVLCTAKTGTTFTVTRGYDGTTAVSHTLGAMIEHTTAAIDYREAGVPALTTTERNALSGDDLWDGRLISNITTDTLDRYDLGTTSWVSFARMSDVTTAVTNGITGKADKTITLTAGNGLTGGGDLSANRSFAINFHTSGTATTVPRSDDARFSDARTPLAHTHDDRYYTETESDNKYATKTDATLAGTTTIGTNDGDLLKKRAVEIENHQRTTVVAYSGSDVSTITEKVGSTSVKITTLTWSSGVLTTITTVAGTTTVTITMNYDGSGNFTGTNRTVT